MPTKKTPLLEEKLKREQQKAKQIILEKYPTLYWAMEYHRNNRHERMSFKNAPYLVELYKNVQNWESFVAIKAVQVMITEMMIVNSFREASSGMTVIYVLPKFELRNRFVSNRIFRQLKDNPFYSSKIQEASEIGGSERLSLIHFGRGGLAFLGSNVEDEFLEIPGDSAVIDELDRCHRENILLLPDRLKASPYGYFRRISNPTVENVGIDELYRDSSQAQWMIQCNHCNQWFTPDFFKHLVVQESQFIYKARDPEYKPLLTEPRLVCDKCGKFIDNRLKKGEWVHAVPNHPVKGIRINQIFSKFVKMDSLIRDWKSAVGNSIKEQKFYNSNLGLAYSAEGSKVFDWELDKCRKNYALPLHPTPPENPRSMGIDVGAEMHVVIRERYNDNGIRASKMLYAGAVPSFSKVARLIDEWKPKMVVVDANPELHEVARLKGLFSQVYSCRFQRDLIEPNVNRKDHHVSVDRTAILDALKKAIDDQSFTLPATAHKESFLQGQYFPHMTASTRIFELNEKDAKRSRFIWIEPQSRPDHFFLAEAYCLLADSLIRDSGFLLSYYEGQIDRAEKAGLQTRPIADLPIVEINKRAAEIKDKSGEQGMYDFLSKVSQESLMLKMGKTFTATLPSPRDAEAISNEIESAISQVIEDDGTFSLRVLSKRTGVPELKLGLILIKQGYNKISEETFKK